MASTYGKLDKHGKAIIAKTAGSRKGPSNKNIKNTRSPAAGGDMAKTLGKKGGLKGLDKGTG